MTLLNFQVVPCNTSSYWESPNINFALENVESVGVKESNCDGIRRY